MCVVYFELWERENIIQYNNIYNELAWYTGINRTQCHNAHYVSKPFRVWYILLLYTLGTFHYII